MTDSAASLEQSTKDVLTQQIKQLLELLNQQERIASSALHSNYQPYKYNQYLQACNSLRNLQFAQYKDVDAFRAEFARIQTILLQHKADIPEKAYIALFILSIRRSNKQVADQLEEIMSSPTSSDVQKTIEYCFRRLQETITRDKLFNQTDTHTAHQLGATADRKKDYKSNNKNNSKGDRPRGTRVLCNVCKYPHSPTCYVQNPEKAPKEFKAKYKDRIEAYQKANKNY